ncbi:hypothetical protein RQ479_04430 [Mesorhizobium sp. ISC25]
MLLFLQNLRATIAVPVILPGTSACRHCRLLDADDVCSALAIGRLSWNWMKACPDHRRA